MPTVQRYTTISGFDADENWRSVTLAPGDEMPDWAPQSAVDNELLYQPLPEDVPYATDEETGTEVFASPEQRMDASSPTFSVGYESSADAVEAYKAGDHPESPEEPEQGPVEGGYESMTKVQLSALAEERGLHTSGTRQELIDRLTQSDAESS